MSSLNTLCEEHLAFSSKLIFEFFDYMITISPDFVTCFLPKLVAHIEKVEWKRGIGSDYTLRYYPLFILIFYTNVKCPLRGGGIAN